MENSLTSRIFIKSAVDQLDKPQTWNGNQVPRPIALSNKGFVAIAIHALSNLASIRPWK